ncbi:hypothetical protein F511_33322 [Dorcoceras hygrometricum]|uniref:Uncharacterized protein n=1 Tax=Dorcoceras hygrometricum TaxID=472368 RepID=A0A2Z7AJM3_9LAMI|nr:hypothetical protein F511_33322 [Dorcoceras hygrometricum]
MYWPFPVKIFKSSAVPRKRDPDPPLRQQIVGSKKRTIVTGDEPDVTKKKRTSKRKASSSIENMDIVSVAQDAVPLQTIEPTSAAPAEQPPVPKHKSKKRRLRLQKGSDDEIVEEQETVKVIVEEDVVEQSVEPTVDTLEKETVSTTDEVNNVIAQVLAETAQMEVTETTEREQPYETDFREETTVEADRIIESASDTDGEQETVAFETVAGEQQLQISDETENRIDASAEYFVKEPVEEMELADVIPIVEEKTSAEGATTIEEILLTIPDAQENYNNLSTQLGFLVEYINRGGDAKKGEGGSSQPQPPPDDQSRPIWGSGSRADDQSRGRVSIEGGRRGSGDDRRRDDRSGSSKRRRSSGGGDSPVRGIVYGPYHPPKRGANWMLFEERQF